MICLPLYSFCFPFSPIDTETIRPAALWIYVPLRALLNPSSSLHEFLPVQVSPYVLSTRAHLDSFIVALYQLHLILSYFEREGSLLWASLCGCGRIREGYQKWRRVMRRSASDSANEEHLRISSPTLNIVVKILQILPWMPKVCYSLLFNQSLCMGLKLAIVVFRFQLGPISEFRAYSNLLVACIIFGGTMSTAGYEQGLFNEKKYFLHVENPRSSTRQILPIWRFWLSRLNPFTT